MFPQDIIMKKRDGQSLSREQISFFIKGVVNGSFADYQSSALLMAIYLNGMDAQETSWLTEEMMRSGDIIHLDTITRPKVDKHSTGGVGDKISLPLAPLAAVCGLAVPMISGRGLGHTGGTLDKLESIPGFRVDLTPQKFIAQLERIDVAMIGQTANLVPADKKLYALRDVTATVESIPLICASIMSKKMAEGIESLVLDVKTGKGAFMKSYDQAKQLAANMVKIGASMQRPTVALLTDMNQPLGKMVGNSLEVIESFDCLKNNVSPDITALTIELAAHMIVLGKVEKDLTKARDLARSKLASGEALEKMRQLIDAHGGDARVVDDYRLLPQARYQEDFIWGGASGYIQEVDALTIGVASMVLGAGRESMADKIDPAVGISHLAKIGDYLAPGERLCRVHYNDETKKQQAWRLLNQACTVGAEPKSPPPLIYETLASEDN